MKGFYTRPVSLKAEIESTSEQGWNQHAWLCENPTLSNFFLSWPTATSNGTRNSLNSTSGGHCATHNMRFKVYVCRNRQGRSSIKVTQFCPLSSSIYLAIWHAISRVGSDVLLELTTYSHHYTPLKPSNRRKSKACEHRTLVFWRHNHHRRCYRNPNHRDIRDHYHRSYH